LAEAAGSVRARPIEAPAQASVQRGPRTPVAPSRAGTKPITGFYPQEVRMQLKILAAEQTRSMEDMLAEALNDLFAKYGKPEIAPAGERRAAA